MGNRHCGIETVQQRLAPGARCLYHGRKFTRHLLDAPICSGQLVVLDCNQCRRHSPLQQPKNDLDYRTFYRLHCTRH